MGGLKPGTIGGTLLPFPPQPMIAPHRHQNILARVRAGGVARVSELAGELGVTEETIRRDLKTLADRGDVERVHGGAVAPPEEPEPEPGSELPFAQRHAANAAAKRAIAAAAARSVEPGQVIALDPSTTACQLALLLPDEPLTVVTNSLVVCSLLAAKPRVEVICTGGTLDPGASAFFGLATAEALEKLRVDRLFFSCRGVDLGAGEDLGRGLSETNDRHAALKLALLRSARAATLLVDASKLGHASTVLYAPVSVADRVIVDRPADGDARARAAVARLRSSGIAVEEADPPRGVAAA